MFQYAAAKHLSIINNTQLKIDTSNFSKLTNNSDHTLQLYCLNITALNATKTDISKYTRTEKSITAIILKALGFSAKNSANPYLYREPDGSKFKPDFFNQGSDKYLHGHFNSYKYFDAIRNLLTEEYSPKDKISNFGQQTIARIEATNSIGVHIRRGDYVTDPNIAKDLEGIITENYYRNAVDYIARLVSNPYFFIFSNDMTWVKENFHIPYKVTYVDFNPPQRGFEDLWIMSKCKHNITAGGSTFSWWAAYLNQNENKIVVRTDKISNDDRYNNPDDYFPPDWTPIKS